MTSSLEVLTDFILILLRTNSRTEVRGSIGEVCQDSLAKTVYSSSRPSVPDTSTLGSVHGIPKRQGPGRTASVIATRGTVHSSHVRTSFPSRRSTNGMKERKSNRLFQNRIKTSAMKITNQMNLIFIYN